MLIAENLSWVAVSGVTAEWRSLCHATAAPCQTWPGFMILSSLWLNMSGVATWKLYWGNLHSVFFLHGKEAKFLEGK